MSNSKRGGGQSRIKRGVRGEIKRWGPSWLGERADVYEGSALNILSAFLMIKKMQYMLSK